jgi:acyl-CoA thioesterase-1
MDIKSPLFCSPATRVVRALILMEAVVGTALAAAGGADLPPRKDHPSFAPIEDQPGLPRVLLIGDSISMQYTLLVRELLDGVANVHRPARNCRSTRQTLAELDGYLEDQPWDVIHFNWGVHDITHLGQNGKVAPPPTGKVQVPLDEYGRNIGELVRRLQKTGATLIWATTTPIGSQSEARGYRRDRDVVAYNAAANRLMKAEHVIINDLYSAVKPRAEELLKDGVHFNEQGARVLAEQTAMVIRHSLPNPHAN